MGNKDSKLVVLQFNACINEGDLQGLSDLMTEDHVFIDSSNDVHRGKDLMVKGWENFFSQYPDYLNHFSILESRGNLVLVIGLSTCSYEPLDGPALWSAKVEDDHIAEWRVYVDNEKNRELLGLHS